jgi:hypothetical protein
MAMSMPIYNHFSNLGKLLSYNHETCPVTKMRLGTLRMIYHDIDRKAAVSKRQFKDAQAEFEEYFRDGHICKEFKIPPDSTVSCLSELENKLLNITKIKDESTDQEYLLRLQFLTRNPTAITQARDMKTGDNLQISGSLPKDERRRLMEMKLDSVMDGFTGIFTKE